MTKSLLDIEIDDAEGPAKSRSLTDWSRTSGTTEVVFRHLEEKVCEFIGAYDYVVGCVAWLTSKPILRALEKKRGASIIVQKEDFLRPDSGASNRWAAQLRNRYEAVPPIVRYWLPFLCDISVCGDPHCGIRCVGNHNTNKDPAFPRAHHKFIVGLDDPLGINNDPDEWGNGHLAPRAVWTGSFNFTANGTRSFENAVIIRDPVIADAYLSEFCQVAAISEPLDWETPWARPEWRIGT
jgi:hypothetical protein